MTRRDIPIIVLWYGPIANIPVNWHICDGTQGTPDLRNRFVVGAGDTYAVDDSGGTLTHVHTFTGDGHNHDLTGLAPILPGIQRDPITSTDPATGITDPPSNPLPFYSLVYIMWTGVYYE